MFTTEGGDPALFAYFLSCDDQVDPSLEAEGPPMSEFLAQFDENDNWEYTEIARSALSA